MNGNFKIKAIRTLKGCYIKDKVYEFTNGSAKIESDINLIGCQDFPEFKEAYWGASDDFIEVVE